MISSATISRNAIGRPNSGIAATSGQIPCAEVALRHARRGADDDREEAHDRQQREAERHERQDAVDATNGTSPDAGVLILTIVVAPARATMPRRLAPYRADAVP